MLERNKLLSKYGTKKCKLAISARSRLGDGRGLSGAANVSRLIANCQTWQSLIFGLRGVL